jgi:YggT family protein
MVKWIEIIINVYIGMIAIRIIATWFPAVRGQTWLNYLSRCTDPYLNFFRRFIRPIGALDLTPMLAYLALQGIKAGLLKLISLC